MVKEGGEVSGGGKEGEEGMRKMEEKSRVRVVGCGKGWDGGRKID